MSFEPATLRQRRIRSELRRLRDKRRYTQQQVAEQMGWSVSKVIRMETGAVRISPGDLQLLLPYYGVTDLETIDRLVSQTRTAWAEQPFWSGHRDILDPEFTDFLAYESAASTIYMWNLTVLPGLVQTESYMRAIFQDVLGHARDNINRYVDVRLRRQERLRSESPPRVHVVLDESVIHRQIGGPKVMAKQLESLLEMNSRPDFSVEVVPFKEGAHAGLRQSFVLLEFDNPDDDPVLYLENSGGQSTIKENPDAISTFKERFLTLEGISIKSDEIRTLIDPILEKAQEEAG